MQMSRDKDIWECEKEGAKIDQSTRYSSLHRTIGPPKSALVMRKEMDFEKQTYSKWTRNKLRVVRRSKDNMRW